MSVNSSRLRPSQLGRSHTPLFAGLPLSKDHRCRQGKAISITRLLHLGGHFHPVATRIEEVYRLAKTVVRWPDHLDPSFHHPTFPFQQRRLVPHFECKVLHPI